ncbi:MAG: hypothetical protein JNL08_12845 [Planctomycetes bacterium]|nr:hypothetical protein [Planctomycetota bacterium]
MTIARFRPVPPPQRRRRRRLVLPLLCALSACGTAPADPSPASAAGEQAPEAATGPMADFARLIGGEWCATLASGDRVFQAWQWGPGQLSLRKTAWRSDPADSPWAGEVFYWHPGQRRTCLLSLHEDIAGVGRGVGAGWITFNGDTAAARLDLRQPRGLRALSFRWTFVGPDRHTEALLEDHGHGPEPLNALEFVRVPPTTGQRPKAAAAPPPTGRWRAFAALVGTTWEGTARDGSRTRTVFEWIPSLEAAWARTWRLTDGGDRRTPALDACFYAPLDTGTLRCLVLTEAGGVFDGDVAAAVAGALQLDLRGHEGDRAVAREVRLEVAADGTLHHRVWSLQGDQRTLLTENRHARRDP